jgi:hypothetical protein
MGHQGKEEDTRNNTTQHLFFLFLLFIKHQKNLQTKISRDVGFFGRDSFYSHGGKKSIERRRRRSQILDMKKMMMMILFLRKKLPILRFPDL